MAIYVCNKCFNYVDNDYFPCTEDPDDESGIALICPDCADQIEEEE